jgi:DNA-binding cell septation regulator SpoVG
VKKEVDKIVLTKYPISTMDIIKSIEFKNQVIFADIQFLKRTLGLWVMPKNRKRF